MCTGKSPAFPAGIGKYVNIAGSSYIRVIGADVVLPVVENLGFLGVGDHSGSLSIGLFFMLSLIHI